MVTGPLAEFPAQRLTQSLRINGTVRRLKVSASIERLEFNASIDGQR